MEMEPQDAARFEEIERENTEMEGICDRILAQPVSLRVKQARLNAVRRDAAARAKELAALAEKYEKLAKTD